MNISNKYKSMFFNFLAGAFAFASLIVISLTLFVTLICSLNYNNVSYLEDVYSLISAYSIFIPVFIYLAILYAYIDLFIYKSGANSIGVILGLCIYLTGLFCNVLSYL